MKISITLRNYRAFGDESPATFEIGEGVTAFVGPNNAGKSSLLRFFFEFRPLFVQMASPSGEFAHALRGARSIIPLAGSVKDPSEIFSQTNSRDASIELAVPLPVSEDAKGSEPELHLLMIHLHRQDNTWSVNYLTSQGAPIRPRVDQVNWIQDGNRTVFGTEKVRFGAVTSLFRAAQSLAQTAYIPAFRNAINIGAAESYFDIDVGQAFIQAWHRYKNGHVKAANLEAIRVTRLIQNVFRFSQLEINASQDSSTLQLTIDDHVYRLEEVGAGLAQFILAMITVAIKKPQYVLVDEPELGLHPSLQVDFVSSLERLASRGLLFATHSMGLARSASNRIYSVVRTPLKRSEVRPIEATTNLATLLGELGYSSYRVLGYETVLLVEGVTEVKTFLQLLRLYKLDHEVVLLPMGGEQLIAGDREVELAEIRRLSDHVHAVIDSERSAAGEAISPKRQRFVDACGRAKVGCFVLERRATENYLTDRAVKAAFGNDHAALGPYDKPERHPNFWGKGRNWLAAMEMDRPELDGTDLGQFLQKLAHAV